MCNVCVTGDNTLNLWKNFFLHEWKIKLSIKSTGKFSLNSPKASGIYIKPDDLCRNGKQGRYMFRMINEINRKVFAKILGCLILNPMVYAATIIKRSGIRTLLIRYSYWKLNVRGRWCYFFTLIQSIIVLV